MSQNFPSRLCLHWCTTFNFFRFRALFFVSFPVWQSSWLGHFPFWMLKWCFHQNVVIPSRTKIIKMCNTQIFLFFIFNYFLCFLTTIIFFVKKITTFLRKHHINIENGQWSNQLDCQTGINKKINARNLK